MKRSSYYFARVLNNRVTVNYYSKRNLLNGVTSLNNRRERGSILSISRHRFPFIIFHGLSSSLWLDETRFTMVVL